MSSSSSKISKGKTATKPAVKSSLVGAPAQYKQPTRKGKKSWRKNIDVQPEEHAMEEARVQERDGGSNSVSRLDRDLFTIDTTGDEHIAKRVKKPRTLRSLEILSKRSAVPALTSKPIVPSDLQSKAKISSADKERLRRIARKGQVGLDGSGLGSAVVSKLKDDPLRDVWTERQTELERLARVKGSWTEVVETARLPNVPSSIQLQRQLQSLTSQTDAVPIPDAGTSYNPQLESHQALIDAAVHEEEARLKREAEAEAKVARYKKIIENRRENLKAGFDTPGGMTIAAGDSQALIDEMETEIEDVELESPSAPKVTKRKTQADRNKAKRQAEERRLAAQASLIKAQRKSMASLPAIQDSIDSTLSQRKELEAAHRQAKKAKLLRGLRAGQKVGKHRVLAGSVDVQLGEDLSENMREVKPEGNLFRDRFRAMQSRSLVEPRVRQLAKRNVLRTKEYEKHAWKRFE